MLKAKSSLHYLLPILMTGLVACGGNGSSTTIGAPAVIDPTVIVKTIGVVNWDENNEVEMASYAYRSIAQSTLLKIAFTNQLASLDVITNLFKVNSSRKCNISGQLTAEMSDKQCFLVDGATVVDCSDAKAVISSSAQNSLATSCQDGSTKGKYLDGFFNATEKLDLTIPQERRTSTSYSAVGKVDSLNSRGEVITDTSGKAVQIPLTDYQFKNDSFLFFFANDFEIYTDFNTVLKECVDKKYTQAIRQGIRSPKLGVQEGSYDYTEFSLLKLEALPSYSCEGDQAKAVYAYSLVANMASKKMGGGAGADTKVSWPDMNIPIGGHTSGTLTLEHKNEGDALYTVTAVFDGAGNVTITGNSTSTITVADFFALSKSAI